MFIVDSTLMDVYKIQIVSKKYDRKQESPLPQLEAWELAIVEFFCRGTALLGLRKSVGMVYGTLYCSSTALAITELQEKLRLSRGAVVEATQLLRRFGAIRIVIKIGERKDFFEAETELKKFAIGALREFFIPGFEKTSLRLSHAEKIAKGNLAKSKIEKLIAWKNSISAFVPTIESILDEKNESNF